MKNNHYVKIVKGIIMELATKKGIPDSLNAGNMSKEDFELMIEESLKDIENNKVYSLDDLRSNIDLDFMKPNKETLKAMKEIDDMEVHPEMHKGNIDINKMFDDILEDS